MTIWSKDEDGDGDGEEDVHDAHDDVYVDGDVHRVTLSGLKAYTEYFVRIRADNTAYDGVFGDPAYFWTRQSSEGGVCGVCCIISKGREVSYRPSSP